MSADPANTAHTCDRSPPTTCVSCDVTCAKPAPRLQRLGTVRRRVLAVTLAFSVMLLVPGASYAQALTYPGSATWQMRSVEWLRDHGGSPLVDRIENWYYTANRPTGSSPDAAGLPLITSVLSPLAPPPSTRSHGRRAFQPSNWVPGRLDSRGAPAIYTTLFRPDAQYPSVVAAVAWIRARDTSAHLVAGTREPGGQGWPGAAQVPPGDVPKLVATFNSGWKMTDTHGGFYLAGRSSGQLRAGQRSLVIDDTGAATVGQWARDVSMNPHVIAVRQNLALIVDPRPARRRPGHHQWAMLGKLRKPAPVHPARRLRGRRSRGPHLRGRGEADPSDARARTGRRRGLAGDGTRHPLSFGLVRLMDAFGARPRCAYQAPTRDGTACRLVPVRRPARLLLPHPGMTLVPERPCVPAT